MAYITTAQLKTYLNVAGSGDDALLGDLIDRAQAMIERHTDRTFEASGDTTRYFDAVRDVKGLRLYLDEDLCQITSVTVDGSALSSSNYVTEPRNETPWHVLRIIDTATDDWSYTGDPEDAIVIVGRWAYSITPPTDVVHATVRLASWLYRQKDASFESDRPVTFSDGVTLLPSRLPQDVVSILAPYRRLV